MDLPLGKTPKSLFLFASLSHLLLVLVFPSRGICSFPIPVGMTGSFLFFFSPLFSCFALNYFFQLIQPPGILLSPPSFMPGNKVFNCTRFRPAILWDLWPPETWNSNSVYDSPSPSLSHVLDPRYFFFRWSLVYTISGGALIPVEVFPFADGRGLPFPRLSLYRPCPPFFLFGYRQSPMAPPFFRLHTNWPPFPGFFYRQNLIAYPISFFPPNPFSPYGLVLSCFAFFFMTVVFFPLPPLKAPQGTPLHHRAPLPSASLCTCPYALSAPFFLTGLWVVPAPKKQLPFILSFFAGFAPPPTKMGVAFHFFIMI